MKNINSNTKYIGISKSGRASATSAPRVIVRAS